MAVSSRAAARIIGVAIIALMVMGYVANFTLLAAVVAKPGFIENAAPHATDVALAAVLNLVIGIVSMGIAILAYPVLRPHSHATALWFIALSAANFALAALEASTLMSMVSLSEAYAKADVSQRPQFEAMRVAVASSRNWAHYIHLMIAGATLFVFYLALFRFALVPRAIAALGIVACAMQVVAVTMPLFGQAVIFALLAPLGLCQVLLALWLLLRGFRTGAIPQNP